MEQEDIESSSGSMDKGDVYILMQLNDVLLYSVDHFNAIKNLLVQYDDLTHIVTKIGFVSFNIDKRKLFKDSKLEKNNDTELDPYVFANVVSKIDRDIDGYDLMTSNIILQIHKFIKQYVMLH